MQLARKFHIYYCVKKSSQENLDLATEITAIESLAGKQNCSYIFCVSIY